MKAKGWWQVTIFYKAPNDYIETIQDCLGEILRTVGSPSIEEVISRKKVVALRGSIPGHRSKDRLKKILSKKIKKLRSIFENCDIEMPQIQFRNDHQWIDQWKKFAKPVRLRKDFIILPTEKPLPMDFPKSGTVLRIDPQMAFGTGRHATTFLCLKEISNLLASGSFSNALDFGTGSGILAMTAQRLGIDKIIAIDNDPQAIAVAKQNARLHQISAKQIHFSTAPLHQLTQTFDLIFANILLNTILEHLDLLNKRLRKKGTILVSGVLKSQQKEMETALKKHGFQINHTKTYQGWICIQASLKNSKR